MAGTSETPKPTTNVTWPQIQMIVGFASVLVSVVMSWSNLGSRIDLLAEKQQNSNEKITAMEGKVAALDTNYQQVRLDVSSIKQTIDDNKARGNLTYATPEPNTLSLATPVSGESAKPVVTPSPTNNYTTNATYISNPQPTSAPQPTQQPVNNNPQPTGVIETITGVLSSLIR